MNPEDAAWQKLVAAARRAPADERETAAPYGFATRVAALAMAAEPRPMAALLERFSWRALGLAALLAVASVAVNYGSLAAKTAEEEAIFDETAVTAVFDLS